MTGGRIGTEDSDAMSRRKAAVRRVFMRAVVEVLKRHKAVCEVDLLIDLAHCELSSNNLRSGVAGTRFVVDPLVMAGAREAVSQLVQKRIIVLSQGTFSLASRTVAGQRENSYPGYPLRSASPGKPLRAGVNGVPASLVTRVVPLIASMGGVLVAGCVAVPDVYQVPRYSYFEKIGFGPRYASKAVQPVTVKTDPGRTSQSGAMLAEPARSSTAQTAVWPSVAERREIAPSGALKMDREFASAKRVVPFEFSRGELSGESARVLKDLVPLALQAEAVRVRGGTDATGSPELNRRLALGRSLTVTAALVKEGVPPSRIKTTYCTKCFVSPNDTEAGRRSNRRVDVVMVLPAATVALLPSAYERSSGAPL